MSTVEPLTYQGKKVSSARLIELWTSAEERFGGVGGRTDRIEKCQQLRRGTLRVTLDTDFLKEHPEIDSETVVSLLPEREGYENDLVAKAGAVEPKISRAPLDVIDRAVDQAEEYESYMRDVASDEDNGIPYHIFIDKLARDGEHGVVVLPSDLDAEGMPDFFEKLSDRAYARLDADQKKSYQRDDGDRRGRYVKTDEKGNKQPNPSYDRDAKGRTRERVEKDEGKGSFKRDHDKSKSAHDEAVRRYLLQHSASTFRVIPALDCYPLLGRGKGKARWSVEGLIERSLLDREELVQKKLGWAMLGDRLLLPRGINRAYAYGPGREKALYLYTAYLMCQDEDGIDHPCIFYTVGGASTWWNGQQTDLEGKDHEVACIDLYTERKITTRRWHYEFGTHTADDDPNWYARPAIWPFLRRILNIEGLETAAHATVQLEAYTGHYYKPDHQIATIDPEAVVDSTTHLLRRPKKPRPGGIEPWAGDVVPFNQAKIGDDAWRLTANYQQSLAQGMAIDQINGESGHAMLVSSSQGQIAKRQIREAALRMFKFCLEADALNRLAAYKCHKIKWPILTTREQPVGHEVRTQYKAIEFEPDWLGDDENPRLNVSYGEEFNLARADLEMSAADRGYGTLKRVAAALGEEDVMNLRVEIEKDKRWKSPMAQMLMDEIVMGLRGMTAQRKALKLQAEGDLTKQGMPGAESGIPTAMLKRAGEGAATGAGKPSMAQSIRGGVSGAQQRGDAMAANAAGALGAA